MKRTGLKAMLLSVAFAALTAQSALAVGTPACTTIGNVATVNYKVGAADQTPQSNLAIENEFIVGNKINFTVTNTDTANVDVEQAETGNVLNFLVTNTGNANQTFLMSWSNGTTSPYGPVTADTMNMLTPGVDALSAASIVTGVLAPGEDQVVTIVADAPLIPSNNDLAVYVMTGTAYKVDGSTAETVGSGTIATSVAGQLTCTADIVFADADSDAVPDGFGEGYETAVGAFIVTADQDILTVAKSSLIYSDPINGAGAGAKLIPGAVVTYTITLTNTSSTTEASTVSIADTLDSNLTFGNSDATPTYGSSNGAYKDGDGTGGTFDCTSNGASFDVVIDGVCTDSSAMWVDPTLTISGLSVPKNDSVEIKFQVTIE